MFMLRPGRSVGSFGDVAGGSAQGMGRAGYRKLRLALRAAQPEGWGIADEPAFDRLRRGHKDKIAGSPGVAKVFSSRGTPLPTTRLGIPPFPDLYPRRGPPGGIRQELERGGHKDIV